MCNRVAYDDVELYLICELIGCSRDLRCRVDYGLSFSSGCFRIFDVVCCRGVFHL